MIKGLFVKFWTLIDPTLYTIDTRSAFGMWKAVF